MITLYKTWGYIKKYWWVVAILAVAVGGAIWARGKKNVLLDILVKKKEFQDAELEVIRQSNEKKVEDIKRATEVYNRTIEKIEIRDKETREKIKRRRKEIIKKIVAENQTDSDKLARDIADEFGFELVEVKND